MYLYHSRAREEGHGLQLVVIKISQSRCISPMLQGLLRRAASVALQQEQIVWLHI
jgi:hypothetical protein